MNMPERNIDRDVALGKKIVTAMDLIAREERPESMKALLDKAVSLFNTNQLGLVLPSEASGGRRGQRRSVRQLATMSRPVTSVIFDTKLLRYCRAHGVELVGELYRLRLHRDWSGPGRKFSDNRQALLEELHKLGLPQQLELDASGWRPPYADDPAVRELWACPAADYVRFEFDRVIPATIRSIRLVRELFTCKDGANWLGVLNNALRFKEMLHAGMYVPPDCR